ncbi:MAG: patatin-like phospholipase family protein [Candidatus Eremiobacteraeota bacterium]|nr:patatin-like phospholipase family protein [Candidatus Eremiobacteraeota bacterium]
MYRQALTISGGGFLGLFSATLLAELEKSLESPIAMHFDLCSGTPIGGVIALAIAAEVPMSRVVSVFEDHGRKIFSNKRAPQSSRERFLDFLSFATKPKYGNDNLRTALNELFGENSTIGDLKHPVAIPALNVTAGSTKVFKTPHHAKLFNDWKLRLVDVALATSAAPTFFPIAEVDNELYVDGGLFANSPDLIAHHELTQFLGAETSKVRILSIGTTMTRYSLAHEDGVNYGAYKWMSDARMFSMMLSAQQQMTEFMMSHMLGERYVRIDKAQSKEQERYLKLDSASDATYRELKGLAASAWRENRNALIAMVSLESAPAVLYYGPNKNTDTP